MALGQGADEKRQEPVGSRSVLVRYGRGWSRAGSPRTAAVQGSATSSWTRWTCRTRGAAGMTGRPARDAKNPATTATTPGSIPPATSCGAGPPSARRLGSQKAVELRVADRREVPVHQYRLPVIAEAQVVAAHVEMAQRIAVEQARVCGLEQRGQGLVEPTLGPQLQAQQRCRVARDLWPPALEVLGITSPSQPRRCRMSSHLRQGSQDRSDA